MNGTGGYQKEKALAKPYFAKTSSIIYKLKITYI